MPIMQTKKFRCSKCGNTFVSTVTDVVMPGDYECQECGGVLLTEEMSASDYVNPAEEIKSLKHTIKSLFSMFNK